MMLYQFARALLTKKKKKKKITDRAAETTGIYFLNVLESGSLRSRLGVVGPPSSACRWLLPAASSRSHFSMSSEGDGGRERGLPPACLLSFIKNALDQAHTLQSL